MSHKSFIEFNVNGKNVEVPFDDRESLYDTLRNELGLTSIKKGCEVGECGACSVLVNGRCVDSCIYLTKWAEGKTIVTVEGLTDENGELDVDASIEIDTDELSDLSNERIDEVIDESYLELDEYINEHYR